MTTPMNRCELALVFLLRSSAALLLTALIPAVMPFAWMKEVHNYLGMGDLPDGPIIGYLTRSLSIMYAMHGALVMFISFDIRRYLPIVKCLASLAILFGPGMFALDIIVGMPPYWVVGEGPSIMIVGGVLLWLIGRIQREGGNGTVV